MTDTTDWPGHPDADPDCECCLGDGLQADGETLCPCIDARKANIAAQTITPAPQPEGDTGPSVVCNGCGWEGHEDGLIATLDAEDGEPSRACPECRTDCNLMDHPPRPSVSVAEADQFDRADWFWRDLDPDDSGDCPGNALQFHPELTVSLIHSSYRGPSRWVFRAEVLDPDSNDTEVLHFDTRDEAMAAAQERAAALRALKGSDQ